MVLLPLFLKEVVRTGTISIFFFFSKCRGKPKECVSKRVQFRASHKVSPGAPSRNRRLSSYDVANGFGPQDASVLPLLADGLFLFTR